MLPGMIPIFAGGGSRAKPSFEAGGSAVFTTSMTTATFTGLAAPSPRWGRRILVAVNGRSTANVDATSVDIVSGGIAYSATKISSYVAFNNSRYNNVSFWVAQVDAGTSVDVVVTYGGACVGGGAQIFSLFDFNIFVTPTNSNTLNVTNGTTGSLNGSFNVTVQKDGAIFAVAFNHNSGSTIHRFSTAASLFAVVTTVSVGMTVGTASGATWTGLTQQATVQITGQTTTTNTGTSILGIALR
jgi:hypothetical protein